MSPDVVNALTILRRIARETPTGDLRRVVDTLDNAGIFAPVDEATGYDVDSEW